MTTPLHEDIKSLIISTLNLEDITPADIDNDLALFSEEGLGLDSIDGLELGLALKKAYGVNLPADHPDTKKAFESVNSLACCIQENCKK